MIDHSYGIIPFRREGDRLHFLLIQHRAGHWSFPKGHKENGESDIEAAQREFTEETGIMAYTIHSSMMFVESFFYAEKSLQREITFFLAKVRQTGVTVQAAEVQDYAWLTYEDALTRITYPEARAVLHEAHDFLVGKA